MSHVILKDKGRVASPRSYQVRWKSIPSSKREVKGEKSSRYYRIRNLVRPPTELSLEDLIGMLEEVSQPEAFHEVKAVLGKRQAWVDSKTPGVVPKEDVPDDVDEVWDMISDHPWCSDKDVARVLKELDSLPPGADQDDESCDSSSSDGRTNSDDSDDGPRSTPSPGDTRAEHLSQALNSVTDVVVSAAPGTKAYWNPRQGFGNTTHLLQRRLHPQRADEARLTPAASPARSPPAAKRGKLTTVQKPVATKAKLQTKTTAQRVSDQDPPAQPTAIDRLQSPACEGVNYVSFVDIPIVIPPLDRWLPSGHACMPTASQIRRWTPRANNTPEYNRLPAEQQIPVVDSWGRRVPESAGAFTLRHGQALSDDMLHALLLFRLRIAGLVHGDNVYVMDTSVPN
ncbi:hypothetical protein HKX48_002480, partial [Thoreauomyces humboldtii]